MANLHFHTHEITFRSPVNRTHLGKFINHLFETEKRGLKQLDYIFCDDVYLLTMNQRFLKHDTLTDIITFDLSAPEDHFISGEIYISIERVRENALFHKTCFKNEFLRVIFHGALHLCGYKDKSKKDIHIMRAKEEDYLHKFVSQETVSK